MFAPMSGDGTAWDLAMSAICFLKSQEKDMDKILAFPSFALWNDTDFVARPSIIERAAASALLSVGASRDGKIVYLKASSKEGWLKLETLLSRVEDGVRVSCHDIEQKLVPFISASQAKD